MIRESVQAVFIRQALAAGERCMKSQLKSKPKLLVVDDEPDNLDLLYRTFHRDYKVLRAENGPAALEVLAREGDIAVIISDQRMPLMSGTEFLSLTAAQYPDIIRIILTGYTDVEDLVEAINAGKVFKYVTKPWNAEELRIVVRQAMDTHNVLKIRTSQLRQALRRETLLNSVTNAIHNAQSGQSGKSPLQETLQTIVETVGQVLEADICILRSFQDGQLIDSGLVYQKEESVGSQAANNKEESRENGKTLNSPTSLNPSLEPEPSIAASEKLRASQTSFGEASSPRPSSNSYNKSNSYSSTPQTSPLEQTVWETRQVIVINDVSKDAQFNDDIPEIQQRVRAYQQANISSSLVVPLISQKELMAVLALHHCGKAYVWPEDEIQLVMMVADQAALALSQARAYERVRALAKQQELINTITNAIRSTLDPQEIFTAITQNLGQALQVDGCALSLWTEEDEFVQCVGLYDGKSAQVLGQSTEPGYELNQEQSGQTVIPSSNPNLLPQSIVPIAGNPVLNQLLESKQPVVLNDLAANSEMSGLDLPLRLPARALLVVPLLADGNIIGSITLRQIHNARHWSRSEVDLAQAVASQAAIAVQQSRLYQKTRQQAERLLELDQQKTEFFQNVSHEFRTPLTLMMGPLESVVEQQKDLPYEQSVIALRNSRRLLRLVNQLLDLQRLDAGRMQSSFRPCDLVEFVGQIVESFRPYCEKKNLNLVAQLNPCPPVYLDIEKFDKVIYNLLSNAMKFTRSGGTIAVTAEPAGDHVRLQVIDTGIGIRKEQIPHLFERFRQAEGSVNRSYEGSGLGLALVKELVELHGGQIAVDSIYSKSTTFTVWLHTGTSHLPLEQVLQVPTEVQHSRAAVELAELELESPLPEEGEDHETSQQENEESTSISTSTSADSPPSASVLVVDDNSDLRSYVAHILREKGYQVWTAKNGEEGVQVAQKRRPQLIVTDLMMPVVSGLDLIATIRAELELKGIPIILLTAKADETSRIQGTEGGADAYLSKPFNDRELLAEVRNLLALKANEQKVIELNSYLTESVLQRFLPPAMVQKAARGELGLDWSPETRSVTVLFSDIVGFTQLSNTLRARRVAELLNEYLVAMTDAVFDNGGTIDKFIGDGILAIFGAPEQLPPNEQVRRAVAAARQMYRSLEQLNQDWQKRGMVGGDGAPAVQFRCGIHQGTVVVGMFGGSKRSDYTAIGPCVNIASRLQEAAEPNTILVSAAVADLLEDYTITKGAPLKLKGIDETVLTFSLPPNAD
ncbi:MAG: response regulator [Coleofasciculaceae cyanobacterium]